MRWIPLVAALLLAGCSDPENPTPVMMCVTKGEPYSCRGGPCYPCLEYGITCPKPTKLAQGNDKLICKLGDE